jgi:hypothetical protein
VIFILSNSRSMVHNLRLSVADMGHMAEMMYSPGSHISTTTSKTTTHSFQQQQQSHLQKAQRPSSSHIHSHSSSTSASSSRVWATSGEADEWAAAKGSKTGPSSAASAAAVPQMQYSSSRTAAGSASGLTTSETYLSYEIEFIHVQVGE